MNLKNKRYLITGASSGLGRALVKQLLKIDGVKITAVARNVKPLGSLPPDMVFPLSLDVAKPENIEQMLDTAIRSMGGIDCLIACAGFGYYEKFEGKDYKHIQRIFQTNVLAPIYTLQRFLQKTAGSISFVVISSALGKFGLPGMALYSATKYALDGFQSAYHFEIPSRLHYMTVYPIGLKTNFWERIDTDIPLPRPLQQADTAAKRILKGLQKERRIISTSFTASAIWVLNRLIPIFIPIYQRWNQFRFVKWFRKKKTCN